MEKFHISPDEVTPDQMVNIIENLNGINQWINQVTMFILEHFENTGQQCPAPCIGEAALTAVDLLDEDQAKMALVQVLRSVAIAGTQ